jgi:hypothetical protein
VTAETETTDEPEVEPEEKASIKDVVLDVLADLGLTKSTESTKPTEEVSKTDDVEEIESPRQQESRMRREVESAIGSLHIHVGDEGKKKSEEPKKEVEQTPGKKPFLERFIGLGA